MAETKLIVGLGNPGREYEKTRHNLGFMTVEALAQECGGEFKKCRYASARTAEVREEGGKIIFALPQTFMNNSGIAVREIVKFENVLLENLIIVCDDIHLAFGDMRLKSEGSDGGHNGLGSIVAHLGCEAFARLRLGVGEPPKPALQVDYVLMEFKREEKALLPGFLDDAVNCLKLWLHGEMAQAMTMYNKRKGNG
jgi:PTH1 family peptidyl-tRNA hydrolase